MLVQAHGSIDTGGLSRDPCEEAVRQVLELIAQGGEPTPRTLGVSPISPTGPGDRIRSKEWRFSGATSRDTPDWAPA